MPVNLDFARLRVTTPDCREVTSPMPLITLPPVPEQVAPIEDAPVAVASEEVKMAAVEEVVTEEPEEREDAFSDAQMLFGKDEKDLTESQRADLEERWKQWDAQKKVDEQVERDAQLMIQLQAEEQGRVEHPIRLQLAKQQLTKQQPPK